MVRPTNYRIRFAINRLVRQYKKDDHTGNISDCPLCHAAGVAETHNEEDCKYCPNIVFGYPSKSGFANHKYPCVHRGIRFKNLEMDDDNNNKMVTFWNEVYAVIPDDRKTFEMTDDLKASILKIAKSVNRRKTKE